MICLPHMNPFFFPGEKKWVPEKYDFLSFLAAGQDPGGEKKWGPDRGQSEAGLAQIDRGKKWVPLLTLNGLSRWPPGAQRGSTSDLKMSRKTLQKQAFQIKPIPM